MTAGEDSARLQPRLIDALAVDDGIGPGKVDVLEDTQRAFRRIRVDTALHHALAAFIHYNQFAGANVAVKRCADAVQRAGFRGEHRAFPQVPHAQGTHPLWVAQRNELFRAHHQQGERTLQPGRHAGDRLLHRVRRQPLLRDQEGDHFRIRGTLEYRSLLLQLLAEQRRVGHIPVVGNDQAALDVIHAKGLNVAPVVAAGGGIARMADGNAPLHPGEDLLVKDLVHQSQILVKADQVAVVDGDAAGLLPAVLQGIQCVINASGSIDGFGIPVEDAEHAAFFVDLLQGLSLP